MERRRLGRLRRLSGRILARLLVVNVVVVLVPIAGLEFARIYERQLLGSLERDMRNQAALVRAHFDVAIASQPSLSPEEVLAAPEHERMLATAARTTRTRVRVLDAQRALVLDSHRDGPPEGAEPIAPTMIVSDEVTASARSGYGEKWPDLPDRAEIVAALRGERATMTRVRGKSPGVLLFLAEPIRDGGEVVGVVYVTRSTQPVLVELYRIRSGLVRVLGVAILLTILVTFALAWSISRPIGRLARAARRVAQGELSVPIPIEGQGEVRELAESFAQMKERIVERLHYISSFSADVAHEFKSPLTSIRGAAELLEEGALDDTEARARFLRNIRLDVERLDRLVSRLLLLSRVEASEEAPVPIDLVEIVSRVAARSASVDQRVEVEVLGPPPVIFGRAADIEIAVSNLVENAVRHAPSSEPVRVIVRGEGATANAGAASVDVVDRGKGMSEAVRARVFERFFTTDPEGGGTGLGLAIVRAIARAHGGDVTFESGETGTRFTLRVGPRKRASVA